MKRTTLLANSFAALLAALPLAAATPGAAAATSRSALSVPSTQALERQVDALFAKWNRPGMPGAVVGVIRDGRLVLGKAYGMADLERGAPMTTATAFTVGSMSKQFTAMSVHLLARDGKLALGDDIRTWVPEVPAFGSPITIAHLLHHTSGLRDFFTLMHMTGWRGDEVATRDDALNLLRRQRALNFAPGQEFLYSNTGYMLLALIVERVSGKPLAEFARERIFEPLGMRHTRFLHGYGTLVPGRASSYLASAGGGYEYVAVGDSMDGAGGLVSTLGDLALWDRNFYDGRVGGMETVAQLQATAVLNDGTPVNYASGLFVDGHRGRRIVEHSGMIGGFKAQLLRFPDQRMSVVVLANTSDLDIHQFPRTIADMVLDGTPAPAPAVPAAPKTFAEVQVDPARLDALAGYYALSPESGIDFTREDGRLMAQGTGLPKIPVFAYGERDFFARAMDAQFTFDAPDKDGIVAGGVLHQNGNDIPARRVVRPALSEADLKKFEGDFYSDELHALYTVARGNGGNGGLVLTYPRNATALEARGQGEFAASPLGAIRYQCGAQGGCDGFTVTTERARNLQFKRVALGNR